MRTIAEMLVVAAVAAISLRRAALLTAAHLRPRPLHNAPTLPSVAFLVSARNESAVAERLLAALGRLEYPSDRLRFVLVCDGCTDATPEQLRAWAHGREDVVVIELAEPLGKAAALNVALAASEGAIVVVADADLVPRPDFLLELMRPFGDARVGAAAGYLRPSNADEGIVARYAAITSWVHQLVTSAGTDRLGLSPPTLGASAFRRSALDAIGCFPAVPVGVDIAASTGLIAAGWRTRFVPSAVADNTVASSVGDFWRQHVRWARAVFRSRGNGNASRSGRRGRTLAQRIETWAETIGYGDRLVFAVAVGCAAVGIAPAWVPVAYLALPGAEVVAASFKAGAGRALPRFLAAAVVLFAADVVASLAAIVVHAARRPYRWQSSRRPPVRTDPPR